MIVKKAMTLIYKEHKEGHNGHEELSLPLKYLLKNVYFNVSLVPFLVFLVVKKKL